MKTVTALLCLVLSGMASQAFGAGESDLQPGKKSPETKCAKNEKFSYILYAPKTYDAARDHKWPVMFIMSPSGGNAGVLDRYIEGADRNQMLLAVSIQSSNKFNDSTNAILAMVDDVLARYPVDAGRCYASGFSGGCRESFCLSGLRKRNIIGILACGAGCTDKPFNEQAAVYGICGSKCFNRWDMAITFIQRIKQRGHLRFFAGGHAWAGKELVSEGMDWLNLQFLVSAKASDKKFAGEKAAFAKIIAADIEAKRESRPGYAYEWSLLLAKVNGVPEASKAKTDAAKLAADAGVKRYLEAEKAVDRFIGKHFNTSVMDYRSRPVTDAMTRDAKALQEKYKDTPFAEALQGFGEPCVKP